jgi:adenosylcobinamide-GDP ribazoletransferase
MRTFIVMLTFFTRIPIPVRFNVEYEDYVKGIGWVPLISVIIGLPLYWIARFGTIFDQSVISAIVLLVYLFITGALHVDGMADTMDAFGSNRSKERMLEIMKDSRIGSFGVLAIVVYAISMITIIPMVPFSALLLFPLTGRTTALVCAKTNHYARDNGMGKSFVDGASTFHILLAFICYGITMLLTSAPYIQTLIPLIIAVSLTALLVKRMSGKIGGITGDVIGFSVEVSQVLYLFVFYIASMIV